MVDFKLNICLIFSLILDSKIFYVERAAEKEPTKDVESGYHHADEQNLDQKQSGVIERKVRLIK